MTYVIGHKAPDTDSVCAALGYAFLRRAMGEDCHAAVAGKVNGETAFVLRRFGVEAPAVLENAAGCDLILVDHAACSQAVAGADRARVLAIIDHHGAGDIAAAGQTVNEPVGATATLVYEQFLQQGVAIPPVIAGLLASAILSDTRHLRAAATKEADRRALAQLCPLAGIADAAAYYAEMSAAANAYEGMTDKEIFYTEYKAYTLGGHTVGITAVNGHGAVHEARCKAMRRCGGALYATLGVEHLYVMVHDAAAHRTDIFPFGEGAGEAAVQALGHGTAEHIVCRPDISRKSEFVPALRRVYEGSKL